MIIDFHYHVLAEDWYPEGWWQTIARSYVHGLRSVGLQMSLEAAREDMIPPLWDPEGETLIAEMEEAGIDRTVILPMDFGLLFGEPKLSIEEQNRAFADLQKRHSDRIVAFATVDPRRANAAALMERAIADWGLRGLNLYPAAGFYPNARETYRLLERVSQHGVPVVVHTGQMAPAPLRIKHGDPIYLDDLLVDFPNITIVAAHMSFGWHEQLIHMGSLKFNLATDISAWQDVASSRYRLFCERLRAALDRLGSERVLWGTDGPFPRLLMVSKDYLELIRSLPEKAPQGIAFTEDEVAAILGGNAARILGL